MESGNPGELIALALKRAGVSHLFTLNGAHIWSVLTAAAELGIRVIDTRHEQSAAFAAEGWAKVTRQCGVAAVTAGPGVTNSITTTQPARRPRVHGRPARHVLRLRRPTRGDRAPDRGPRSFARP